MEIKAGNTVSLYTDRGNEAVSSDGSPMSAFGTQADFRLCVMAELENLDAVHRFILGNEKLPAHLKKKLCLAAEEIFVNICSYAYGQESGNVEIGMKISDQVFMEFRDSGREFHPLENMVDAEEYDMDTQVGGLGRLIAFELADQVTYQYSNNSNILTLMFHKEESR